jgi:Arc/MetJ family transcription regulator
MTSYAEVIMRTTLDLDDDLLKEASRRVHAPSKTALVELALQALIRESARTRLAEAGGTMPDLEAPARRRTP